MSEASASDQLTHILAFEVILTHNLPLDSTGLVSYTDTPAVAPDEVVPSTPINIPGIGYPKAFPQSLPAKNCTSWSLTNTDPDTDKVSPLLVVQMLTYLPLPSIVTKGGLVVVPSEVTRIVLIT